MGEYKYRSLATVALKLVAIPTSNADRERVFSHVRRIKNDFRSSLSPTTISSLIGRYFNKVTKCCEQTKLDESFLVREKQCTHERISRISHLSSPIASYDLFLYTYIAILKILKIRIFATEARGTAWRHCSSMEISVDG